MVFQNFWRRRKVFLWFVEGFLAASEKHSEQCFLRVFWEILGSQNLADIGIIILGEKDPSCEPPTKSERRKKLMKRAATTDANSLNEIHAKNLRPLFLETWLHHDVQKQLKKEIGANCSKTKISNKIAFFDVFGQFSGSGRVGKRLGRSLHAWGTFLELGGQSKKKSNNRDFERSI